MVRAAPFLPLIFVLAGCGDAAPTAEAPPRDPHVAQALDDPLMTDPELSSRNEAASALTIEADPSLPVLPAIEEAIALARADAEKLVGGASQLADLPPPVGEVMPLRDNSAAAHLAALPGAGRCGALRSSARWAALMPAALPIYPRGATTSAAGSDVVGCQARVVTFTTPVALDAVLAFYWARARAAMLAPVHRTSGAEHVLAGSSREGLAMDLRARRHGEVTVVRLATLAR